MKQILALSAFVVLSSFSAPRSETQLNHEKPFTCSVSLECGGVTVTASGGTCAEAGQKAGAACDKILE